MNTNTMELNMNEMELVNGGTLFESLTRITYSCLREAKEKGTMEMPLTYIIAAYSGYFKGIYDEIAGEGLAST